MRVLIILAILLGIAIFLKPSRFKKFFLVYILTIGSIGFLVYQGNDYVGKMSATRIPITDVALTDFCMDTSLQIFLKGIITNNSPDATLKEINLRFTLYANGSAKKDPQNILGTQDIKLFIRIGPGEHHEILQKLALEQIDPSQKQLWDVRVISVRAALL